LKTFEELGVCEEIRRAIEELGFEQPMPVQEQVIPYLLNSGKDVIALAQTGTGKTAAFGIPVLQQIDRESRNTQALILSPTRELCLQIADDLSDFAKYLDNVSIVPVYGGASIITQIHSLRHGVQIIVATPGRLIDLIERGVAKLDNVKNVVLDEADEMLNMGFADSINAIFEHLPEERHTLLFSATMSREIERIATSYLHEYEEIVVGSRNEGAENVNHIYYMVNARDKYLALKRIVDYYPNIYAIIFCRTKLETQEIADKLIKDGYNAESLHGDLSQQQRDLTMQKFRQHNVQLLVATDVAARGLDVEDLTHVINYGLPDDIESYTHRSGRTGRAGKKGTSISIIHTREKSKIRRIEKEIGKEFVDGTLPTAEEICKKQLYKTMDQIMKTDVDEDLIAPYMTDINRWFEYIDKEDVIKKVVMLAFGRFLDYYKNAPEIVKPSTSREKAPKGERKSSGRGSKSGKGGERRQRRGVEPGYRRLFINLGKDDGFYPGEVMQLLNKRVKGHPQVGHIDLLKRFSYIEVPERDANKVMDALTGANYKGREVRCNDADEGAKGAKERRGGGKERKSAGGRRGRHNDDNGDWRVLIQGKPMKLKGEVPDFSEEGWARRRPKKR
jgi:ATP-dependent RNA helicase DeaD